MLAVFVKGRTALQQDLAKRKAHDRLVMLILGRFQDSVWHQGIVDSTEALSTSPPNELEAQDVRLNALSWVGALALGKDRSRAKGYR